MKKIIVLIAILSLAACGGGTGGGSVSVNPDDGTVTFTPNQTDNGNNTGDNENTGGDNTQNDDTSDNNDNGNTQDNNQNNNDDNNSSSDDNENTGDDNNQNDDQNTGGDTQIDNTDNQDDNSQINNPGDNIPDTPVVPVDILNPDMLNNLADINDAQNMFDGFRFVFDDNGNVIQFLLTDGDEDPFPVPFQREALDTNRFSATEPIYTFSIDGIGDIDFNEPIEDRGVLADRVREQLLNNGYSESTINEICNHIMNDPNFGEWEDLGTLQGDFHTLGKVNGLRYSDFGHFTVDDYDFSFVYQGGIENKKIDPSIMQTMGSVVFNGSAAAELQHNYEVNGIDVWDNEEGHYGNRFIATDTGAATLTFNNGTETINMPFNNWYTVNIQKTGDHIDSVHFTGDEKVQDENWRVMHRDIEYSASNIDTGHYDGMHAPETSQGHIDGAQVYSTATAMATTYYGDGGIPSEATSFIHHQDEYFNIHRTIWFDAVFGGTKSE